MKFKLIQVSLLLLLVTGACKKSKTKKQIAGTWSVVAMYADEKDFLLQKKAGKVCQSGCDTISFERVETLKCSIVFNESGSYTRTKNTIIKYLDTAATRLQCMAVYADSVIDDVEEGTWRFEGKETLELIAQNNNYEGNKLVSISNEAMEWQTDLKVDNGFVIFEGIKTTKFIKQ